MTYIDIKPTENTAWGLWQIWQNNITSKLISNSPFSTTVKVVKLENEQDWEYIFHNGMHLHHPHPPEPTSGGDYLCSDCTVMAVF